MKLEKKIPYNNATNLPIYILQPNTFILHLYLLLYADRKSVV